MPDRRKNINAIKVIAFTFSPTSLAPAEHYKPKIRILHHSLMKVAIRELKHATLRLLILFNCPAAKFIQFIVTHV